MHRKVSSDWLTDYLKATRPVLEIFKMAGYFPDSPRILYVLYRIVIVLDKYLMLSAASAMAYMWMVGRVDKSI